MKQIEARRSRCSSPLLLLLLPVSVATLLLSCAAPAPTEAQRGVASESTRLTTETAPVFQAAVFETTPAASDAALPEEGMLKVSVDSIMCTDCVQEIESAVRGIEGVDFVYIDSTARTAQVFFDPKILQDRRIITEELAGAGYRTLVLEETGQ